uniref:Myb/SANT-like domain-containing protein n=1 Tax=Chenopodium quinoa TaxID=63459 RepID=A0A803N5Y7_CHEQI
MLVLRGLYKESDVKCKSELRVNRRTFNIICEMLRDIGDLSGTKNMSLQEIVAMFLYTLAHHKKNRSIGQYFFRSGETVSRQFYLCLRALLKLHEVLLYNPTPILDDCEDERWKFFKNCLGALDGTYINVNVPSQERPKMEASNRGRGKNKRYWTYEEDAVLIRYLHELSCDPKWKCENGFKNGYMNKLEEMINGVLPNCGLRAVPHIESRIKHWSEKYSAFAEMLSTSGFGWDAEKKLLQVDKVVYDEWVKTHKKAKGLFGVPFIHYETLAEIYAKDKATGDASESFVDAIEEMDQEIDKQPFNVQSDEEDDVSSTHSDTYSSISQSGKRPMKIEDDHITPSKMEKANETKVKGKNKVNLKSLCRNDDDDLVASLRDCSNNFGKIFENINVNLGTMASAWSKAEEREQRMDEKVNKVLDEVMKLDGISPSEALEVATILMVEEHKLRIFYQAPLNMKKQYAIDLLKK